MESKRLEHSYEERGPRAATDLGEARVFLRPARDEGGRRAMPAAAAKFAARFATTITRYPGSQELPNWLRALVERKAPVQELAEALGERLRRAPSEENQELGWVLANEIARMPGGAEALTRHLTAELLSALGKEGGEQR